MVESQTEEKAWNASFTERGVTYAASLFWQPLLNENKPMPEVKEAAENILEGADLFVTRKGKSSQFGLAASSQGFTQGQPSAAIALITALGNVTSFLGVFKVNTGWWYICFRNDVILSDGDTLFVNEKDAKNQLIAMLSVPDWDIVFAPAEWGIEDTKADSIGPILERGIQTKLAKINANNDSLMLAVIVACFAVVLWFGYSTLKDLFFAQPEEPVIAPVEIAEPQLPPEPKPWVELPNPRDVLRECYLATQKVVQIVTPGWHIEGITCSGKAGLVTSWRRELGRLTWIEQALNVSGVKFSSRVLGRDGNTVMVSVPIGEITKLNSPPEYNEEDLVNTINDLNQTLGIDLHLSPKTWVSPRGTTYKLMTYEINSNNDPLIWSDLLMKFSGLTVDTITYDIGSSKWTYKGEIYETSDK